MVKIMLIYYRQALKEGTTPIVSDYCDRLIIFAGLLFFIEELLVFLNSKANSEMGTITAVISIVYHGKSTPYGSMEIHCISSPVGPLYHKSQLPIPES